MPRDKSDVRLMSYRIAARYALMNPLMTMGMDRRWRRLVVERAGLAGGSRVLDIAAGTGDIAFEIRRRHLGAYVAAADFSLPMMEVGRRRPGGGSIRWLAADALDLPFADNTFDAVTSGFLLRNVQDIDRALTEQHRVLKPGGRVVSLDTSPPPPSLVKPIADFHIRRVIPLLGGLAARDAAAYSYLSKSTLSFKNPPELACSFERAGFADVGFRSMMLGALAIHWGRKNLT